MTISNHMISSDLTSSSHIFEKEKPGGRRKKERKKDKLIVLKEKRKILYQELDGSTTETVVINLGRTS